MPDLGNLLAAPPPPIVVLQPCDTIAAPSVTSEPALGALTCAWETQAPDRRRSPASVVAFTAIKKGRRVTKSLDDHVRAWVEARVRAGVPEQECSLPFLCNAPRLVGCCLCRKNIYAGDGEFCSVRGCESSFHRKCARKFGYFQHSTFKCPQHACFVCKRKANWRCLRCTIAAHTNCCPWPDGILFTSRPSRVVCWKHPKDWRFDNEYAIPTSSIEEAFHRLPLPYTDEEFKVDALQKDASNNELEPSPYVHIKRNIYLVKKKRVDVDVGGGCTNCNFRSFCGEDCECRCQSISCSKACRCSSLCTNRPFRKEKKIRVVKTQFCGWGVEALESIAKGDFVIEYIGEVINDAQCEQRLWDMKHRGDKNFYMCEIRKDFTIDATFKGNASRFLNHSCNPNCKLEKWQVEGEVRVGVFASRAIEIGESLTYDYRFEHFGPMVKCHCGATNCQGYLGSQKKMIKPLACWGCKRKRTSTGILTLVL